MVKKVFQIALFLLAGGSFAAGWFQSHGNPFAEKPVEPTTSDAVPLKIEDEFLTCTKPSVRTVTVKDGQGVLFCKGKSGKPDGLVLKWWTKNGMKVRQETWFQGKPFGPAKSWDNAGRIVLLSDLGDGEGQRGSELLFDYTLRVVHLNEWARGHRLKTTDYPLHDYKTMAIELSQDPSALDF